MNYKLVIFVAICMFSLISIGHANQNSTHPQREMRSSANATLTDLRVRSDNSSLNRNQTASNSTRSRSNVRSLSTDPNRVVKKSLWQRFVDFITAPFTRKNEPSKPLSGKYFRTSSRRRGTSRRNTANASTTTTTRTTSTTTTKIATVL